MVKCEKCGAEYGIGDFPFCRGNVSDHGPMHGFDDAFEPYWDEHLAPEPVWIGSRSERKALMKEKGFEFRKKAKAADSPTLYFDMKR